MARPLGKILPLSSRLAVSIPSVYRRGYAEATTAAASVPRSKASNTLPDQMRQRFDRMRPKKYFIELQYPELEAPAPAGVGVNKTHLKIYQGTKEMSILFGSLRDSCKCSMCVDPHSKQRNFRTSDIPDTIQPRYIEFTDDQLVVRWKDDIPGYDADHMSKYDMDTLMRPVWGSTYGIDQSRIRKLWDKKYMEQSRTWISYEDYMNNRDKFAVAMRDLSKTGLIFIKDIPDSREEVAKLANRMGPLRNTFYGPTWDVRKVPNAENVAYTNQFLGFHMDLMYMRDPPGYQLLHCLENSCQGGESMFADAFRAARIVWKTRQDYFWILSRFELSYEYNHEGAVYHNKWPVFETVPGKWRDRMPPLKTINYSPPFQGAMHSRQICRSFAHSMKFKEALRYFLSVLENEASVFQLKLDPGQCVIFENRRVVHARRHFDTNSGHRWLAGAYVDDDALISQFRRIKRDYPELMTFSKEERDDDVYAASRKVSRTSEKLEETPSALEQEHQENAA